MNIWQLSYCKDTEHLLVISIVQLVPVSGQFNCTKWRKLNAYDTITTTTTTQKCWSSTLQN